MLSLVVVDSSIYQTYLHSEFNYGNIFGSFALRSDAEANLLCIQFKYILIQKKTALLGTYGIPTLYLYSAIILAML